MSMISTITVNNKQYNMVRAPATQQLELSNLIGPRVMMHSVALDDDIEFEFIKGILISETMEHLNKIATIVLHQTVMNGTNDRVTIDSFQDDIMSYYELLAKGVVENLKNFFASLSSVNRDAREKAKQAK